MLILLPPSEGKSAPRRGKPLDPDTLSFPVLGTARAQMLDALVSLCIGAPDHAADVLGLGKTQSGLVAENADLRSAPTARADAVYSGVLYEALDLGSLPTPARRRAGSRLAVASALFGLLRPGDRIPAYRLSGTVSLPGVGPVARHWAGALAPAVEEASRGGLVLDLRSSTYASFWKPTPEQAHRVATVRVLHEVGGTRKVVSHFNKATKGRLVRDLLLEGSAPRRVEALAELLGDRGWKVERVDVPAGRPAQLDVIVDAI